MTKDLSSKKTAFQKLLALAEDRSFDIYETSGDIYGVRAWPMNWSEQLVGIRKCSDVERQKRLNETLFWLTRGDEPKTIKQLNFEKEAICLTLQAGADPNFEHYHEGSVFQCFMDNHKRYGALEVAKSPLFQYPKNIDDVYRGLSRTLTFYLIYGFPYPRGTKEEVALNRQITEDDKELVKTLFQKRMYPHQRDTFKFLLPIIQKEIPDFFDREKKAVITQLQKAKTPVQIWAAITGQQKEKE